MNFDLFQCGVIECVPDSKSRDQIGKQTDISLDQYFMQKYGDQDSPKFQEVNYFIGSFWTASKFFHINKLRDKKAKKIKHWFCHQVEKKKKTEKKTTHI